MDGRFETYIRPGRGFAAAPTHDGLTLVIAGWPESEFEENKKHVEQSYLSAIDLAPAFAERLRAAKRQTPFAGAMVPNFFRKPYGPGWALVGDAGYNKDFITAQGILDAFRDAETCAGALDQAFTGARPFDEVMEEYQRDRDRRVLAMYQFTCRWHRSSPRRPRCSSCLPPSTAIRRQWILRADERRHDVSGGVLRARTCRRDDRRELMAPS